MKIERYQAYKDSEIEWLGEVPKHWSIRKAKTVCSHIKDGTHGSFSRVDIGYPLLSVRNIVNSKFVLLDDDSLISEEDFRAISKSLKIKAGDLQLAIVGATMGKVALVPENMPDFVTQRSLATLRPIIKVLTSKFFLYFASSSYFQDTLWSNTSYSAQPGIYLSSLSNIDILLPSIPEQKAIAHYLDTKTAQIDRKIDLLTQKATLYSNLKQSLINETVTRGLDKSVPMKDSGIEWIGEVPEHWGLCKLKDITFYQEGPGIMADDFQERGIPLIRISGMKGKRVSLDGCNYLDPTKVSNKWKHFKLQEGDLLVSASATTGVVAKVSEETIGAIPYTGLIRFKSRRGITRSYLQYFLSASIFINQIELQKSGTTIQHYGPTHLSRVFAILPPLCEQKAIADYLDTKTAQIDQIIQTINTQIEKLKELRKTLINDVVTGKIRIMDNG